jgi:hypothetical protein
MKKLWIALFCVLGCAGAQGQTQTYQEVIRKWRAGKPLRVVLIGNSISEGFYANGWEKIKETTETDPRGLFRITMESQADETVTGVATKLRGLLRSKNPKSVLVNDSGGGWDTSQTLGLASRKYGTVPPVDVIASVIATVPKYDAAFVALQINDLAHGLPLETFAANTRTIVQRLMDAGIVPILVKENDINRPGFEPFIAEIDVIAKEKSLGVVDTYTPFHQAGIVNKGMVSSGLLHDYNLHPNQAGHDLMFKAYAEWFNQPLTPLKVKRH